MISGVRQRRSDDPGSTPLNHVSGSRSGIVGIYQRYDYQPELRIAVQKWQDHLHALLPISEGTNV